MKLTVLGATGSIGVSTLDVVARHPERFEIVALTGHRQVDVLAAQCIKFRPAFAVVGSAVDAQRLTSLLKDTGLRTEVLHGADALAQVASLPEVDAVMAAIVGAAPSVQEAVDLVTEYQKKNLYIFCAAKSIDGKTSVPEQLLEGGVQIGWPTRIVPFSPDIAGAVFALGFANRAAMAFGGVKPGAALKMLLYNKDRIFAFVNAVSQISDEWYANAAGCINWGFPTITNQDIPQVLPTGICTYEHVVSNVPMAELGQKSIEVRGLKVAITEIELARNGGDPETTLQ